MKYVVMKGYDLLQNSSAKKVKIKYDKFLITEYWIWVISNQRFIVHFSLLCALENFLKIENTIVLEFKKIKEILGNVHSFELGYKVVDK